MIYYEDKKYGFWEMFNEQNGTLIRSDVLGTKKDPFMRSFPELIDVGIKGHCEAGKHGICRAAGVDCYQDGSHANKKDMSVVYYQRIVEEAKGKTFQIALGGAGDPNKHRDFNEILYLTKKNGIIPNLTTSGFDITVEEVESISNNCGAVAVSYYSNLVNGAETNELTINAIKLLSKKIQTNIHYVISKDSIREAIFRLNNDAWPEGINAIVFLLYKPVGLGVKEKTLINKDQLDEFMKAALSKKHRFSVGFDTCFTPILLEYTDYIDVKSIDACEAARFSMYIDSEMNAYPCSFDNQEGKYKIPLHNISVQEAWESELFELFRRRKKCTYCNRFELCLGGCGLNIDINNGLHCNNLKSER